MQFYDAVSSGNSDGDDAPWRAALFHSKALAIFLPESVRKTPSFTHDFSGFGLVYELKMTPKFAVKK